MTISATETACDVYESALGCRDRGVIYRIVWVCYGVGSEGSALLLGVSGVVLRWFLLDICQSRYAPLEFVHEGFSLYTENPGALISLPSMFVLPSELHLSCDCKPALKHSEISLFPIANPKRIKLILLDEALLWKPCSNSTARLYSLYSCCPSPPIPRYRRGTFRQQCPCTYNLRFFGLFQGR